MTMQLLDETMTATDRERELGAIISAYNDVTERLKGAHERLSDEVSRLRDELQRKNAELRRRERLAALGEMAAGLAHEVRNPLGGIALYASLLERQLVGDSPAFNAARKIGHGVRSLERLVCEILDFAQEDRLEKQTCRLGRVLAPVEDTLAPWLAECQARLDIEPEAKGIEIYCDPTRLGRVLSNLLLNGAQAAGKNGWVKLTAQSALDGVKVEITDSGPGIPEVDLHRVFNPFFTTKASGTGLGLAICHRIIEAHGGTIRACNGAGGGACFVVWLPSEGD